MFNKLKYVHGIKKKAISHCHLRFEIVLNKSIINNIIVRLNNNIYQHDVFVIKVYLPYEFKL